MKRLLYLLLIITLSSTPILAQTITPKQFLELFASSKDKKAVELIDEQLQAISPKWKLSDGNSQEAYIYVKWHYPQVSIYDAEFYLLREKNSNKMVEKVIYTFVDKELFKNYLSSIKSLTGIELINSERATDGSTRLDYESQGVSFVVATYPTKIANYTRYGINTTYSITMFYK